MLHAPQPRDWQQSATGQAKATTIGCKILGLTSGLDHAILIDKAVKVHMAYNIFCMEYLGFSIYIFLSMHTFLPRSFRIKLRTSDACMIAQHEINLCDCITIVIVIFLSIRCATIVTSNEFAKKCLKYILPHIINDTRKFWKRLLLTVYVGLRIT